MRRLYALTGLALVAAPIIPTALFAQSLPARAGRPVTMPDQEVVAQLTPKVVLLGMEAHYADESWPAVERRLTAELKGLGLEVKREVGRARGSEERLAELGARASANRALAAVRIERREGRRQVRVWLYDALTSKMLLRRIEIKGGEERGGAASVALQAVDLLHASLIELRLKKRKVRGPAPPPSIERLINRQLPVSPGPPRDLWRGQLGAGLVVNPHVGASWGLELGLAVPVWRWIALSMSAHLPLASAEVRQGADSAAYQALLLRADLRLEPWSRWRLSPALEAGVTGLWASVEGEASPPKIAQSDSVLAALPRVGCRAALRVTDQLRLVAAAGISVAITAVTLRFSGDEVARAGRPQIDAALLLEWTRRDP